MIPFADLARQHALLRRELDPVIARVVSLTPEPQGTVVRLEILPGDPLEYADALARARLLSA